ncbi:MAG TPA: helicase HerA-like domain-containing protein [Kofleriaceae bacterium]|nr:helicase HerA-like domain-containing protein [Kofleriaceae bacterium]
MGSHPLAPDPDDPLALGERRDEPGEPVQLPVQALLRHVMALGSSGSGKTVFCKVLAEEAALRGIPVIAIDPQGDLASLALAGAAPEPEAGPDDTDPEHGAHGEIHGEHGELHDDTVVDHWAGVGSLSGVGAARRRPPRLHDRVDVVVFTPASRRGVAMCADPVEAEAVSLPHAARVRAFSRTAGRIVSLLGYDLDGDEGAGLIAVFDRCLNEMADEGRPASSLRSVTERLEKMGTEIERYGRYLNERKIRAACQRAARLDVGARRLLFHDGVPIDIDVLLGRNPAAAPPPGKTRISIIYLNTLEAQEDKDFVVATVADRLVSWMLQNPSPKVQALFYIDEVAPFMPPVRKPACKEDLQVLFKQARKFGVGCVVATQNPGDVDYKAMGQFGTWALGRLATRQDLKKVEPAVRSLMPAATPLLEEVPSLRPGELVLLSPDNFDEPCQLATRWLHSDHRTLEEEKIEDMAGPWRQQFAALERGPGSSGAGSSGGARGRPISPLELDETIAATPPEVHAEAARRAAHQAAQQPRADAAPEPRAQAGRAPRVEMVDEEAWAEAGPDSSDGRTPAEAPRELPRDEDSADRDRTRLWMRRPDPDTEPVPGGRQERAERGRGRERGRAAAPARAPRRRNPAVTPERAAERARADRAAADRAERARRHSRSHAPGREPPRAQRPVEAEPEPVPPPPAPAAPAPPRRGGAEPDPSWAWPRDPDLAWIRGRSSEPAWTPSGRPPSAASPPEPGADGARERGAPEEREERGGRGARAARGARRRGKAGERARGRARPPTSEPAPPDLDRDRDFDGAGDGGHDDSDASGPVGFGPAAGRQANDTDARQNRLLALLGGKLSMTSAEFADRAGISERTARAKLKALVTAGHAGEFREERTARYWARGTGARPDLGMKARVLSVQPNVDHGAAEAIGRAMVKPKVLGIIGGGESFAQARLVYRLVYRVAFEEKVKRPLLGRLIGPSHEERLGSLYLHPCTLDVLLFSADAGIHFATRLPDHASEVDDLDGFVTFLEVRPGDILFDEDEWQARCAPALARKRLREAFGARPGAVTPVFVPLWKLLLQRGGGDSYRVETIDALSGRPVDWPESD